MTNEEKMAMAFALKDWNERGGKHTKFSPDQIDFIGYRLFKNKSDDSLQTAWFIIPGRE